MAASPPPPYLLEWSPAMQIHILKACQGLKRGLFNLCKAVWALSPLCSGWRWEFQGRKKKPPSKYKRRRRNYMTTAAAGEEVLLWAAADLHVSQQDKLQDLSEMPQLKGGGVEKWSERVFYGPLPLLTHAPGKIHHRETIPASAQLNQQIFAQSGFQRLCGSFRETKGRPLGENDTI